MDKEFNDSLISERSIRALESSHVIYLRVSKEEHQAIRKAAGAKSMNQWCLEVLLEAANRELKAGEA